MAKRFITAFAEAGDRAAMPDAPTGSDSNYQTGYTSAYEEDPVVNPTTAKFVERDKSNQLYNDITSNIKEWQEQVFPEFITSVNNGGVAFSYSKGAIVRFSGVNYISTADSNTEVPPAGNWSVFLGDLTTEGLINSTADYDSETVINTVGYRTVGVGSGSWKQSGATGQAPSQTVYKAGNEYFITDANGNEWELLPLSTGLYCAKSLGFQMITSENTLDYSSAAASNLTLSATLLSSPSVDFGRGVYPFNGSVDFGDKVIIRGCGYPQMSPFPQLGDDTEYMRPGYKHLIPGCAFLFTGSATKTKATVRSDQFASFTYAARVGGNPKASVKGVAILMDMDVLDSGGSLTTPATDNRSNYNVGLLLDDTTQSENEVIVFGYWDVAGTVIASFGDGGNPDYNKFVNGSTMGDYGLALIGNDTAAGDGAGLSGTQGFGFQLFGNDHKSREPQTVGTHEYGHCLFIDGKTAAVDDDVNGHSFFGGGLRTYSNRPLALDNCSNLLLSGCPLEFPSTAEPSTVGNKFTATVNTSQISFMNLRNFSSVFVDHAEFNDVVTRYSYFGDSNFHSCLVGSEGKNIRMTAVSGKGVPQIQFTDGMSSSTSGFTFDKQGDELTIRNNNVTALTIDADNVVTPKIMSRGEGTPQTIAGDNSITVNDSYAKIQVGAISILDTIKGGKSGMVVSLSPSTNSDAFTIQSGTGNVRMDIDITLNSNQELYELMYQGAFWVPIQSGTKT